MKASSKDVVSFLRVSSLDQEQNTSLESQLTTSTAYAKDCGLNVIKKWAQPESAWKSGNRTHFNEMISYVIKNNVKHLIFDCPDRASRNEDDKNALLKLIDNHGVSIHFARERKIYNQDSSPEDRLFFNILFAFANYYSNDLSRKVKRALVKKVEANLYPSFAPFGYINVKDKDGVTGIIVKDPERYKTVIEIFEMCAYKHYSTRRIVQELKNKGVLTRKTLKRPGTFLNKARVHNLLRNPVYHGWFKWNGKIIKGSHEPIIDKTLFDKAQEALGTKPMVKYKRNYPFGSLIKCGTCGCTVGGGLYKKNKYTYYRCNNSRVKHKPHYFEEGKLFETFKDKLKSIQVSCEHFATIKDGLLAYNEDLTKDYSSKIKILEQEKSKYLKMIDGAYDAYIQGGSVSKDYWKRRDSEYRQRIEQIENELSVYTQEKPFHLKEALAILEPLKNIVNIYENANREQKGEIIRLLVLNCTANEKTLEFKMKKPFSLLEEGLSIQWRE